MKKKSRNNCDFTISCEIDLNFISEDRSLQEAAKEFHPDNSFLTTMVGSNVQRYVEKNKYGQSYENNKNR